MTLEYEDTTQETKGSSYYDPFVWAYFKLGSVDTVIRLHPQHGVSFAELHRELDKRGIIKLKGYNSGMKHAFYFFQEIVSSKLPIERLYKSMPPSLKEKVSFPTLHRIWQNLAFTDTPEEEIRRFGTMLVIQPEGNEDVVLVGRDVSPPNDKYGKKFGAWTFPMGFSSKGIPREGALRIFQQEVATPWAVNGFLSARGSLMGLILPEDRLPFMRLNIADVGVNAFQITLPRELCDLDNLDSFKLTDYRWTEVSELALQSPEDPIYRSGVVDVARKYLNLLSYREERLPICQNSTLNSRLRELFVLPVFKQTVWART
ncbi:hypothetical protein A2715_04590 [Candidatus Woesebacteria bacterium RIFCSPHIGHO2_01_FULL_39_32]|uniref:Nudix hydrolase domain-containing protein n=1 Tax=Candidatus Woesebacteria bacterium RIFCSPLOWO2_01_FULL_39_25 TaxID=1802521 RepID=A0A1F8BL82_9BACT|nr:MAG: hypothetical protein A2124_02645 [Candidatus Woesebacteria bacterium GWB1_37_5]OGM25295.1 MAG: hypothetical protein A2715_04590 [Candidatus Woesebacteria bacterium RIFCSPHIGHO2_01_FULL_39_32]OGM37794.1 MAG: hypothetical protein A3F01_01800 [Candidatus Woesebacteria bacterium RIFCSPHIGHO2_12_FULL_38_11]OGM64826.1 MAG: hypothetical protein A2893_04200 [Candidatus Woesebacteria bacterium RIFCSPLOWO2_01_FULL_39_25]